MNFKSAANVGRFVAQTTGAGAVTNGLGNIEDAESITIFMMTTAGLNSSQGVIVQVSQFNPALASSGTLLSGQTFGSTNWHTYSTGLVTSSGSGFQITNVSFRGIRLSGFSSAATSEVVAHVTKQIWA